MFSRSYDREALLASNYWYSSRCRSFEPAPPFWYCYITPILKVWGVVPPQTAYDGHRHGKRSLIVIDICFLNEMRDKM